jgi:hypothetical protein
LLAKIYRLIAKLETKDAKYDPKADYFGGQEYRVNGVIRITKPWSHYLELVGLRAALIANLATYYARCKGQPPAPCKEAQKWVAKKWELPDPNEAIHDDSGKMLILVGGGALMRAADASLAAWEAAAAGAARVLAPQGAH